MRTDSNSDACCGFDSGKFWRQLRWQLRRSQIEYGQSLNCSDSQDYQDVIADLDSKDDIVQVLEGVLEARVGNCADKDYGDDQDQVREGGVVNLTTTAKTECIASNMEREIMWE